MVIDLPDLPKIHLERVVLTRVKIALHEPFRISSGSVSQKESVVVQLQAEEGEGFGEASPMGGSFYSADTPESAWRVLAEELVPRLIQFPEIGLQDLDRKSTRLNSSH